MSCSTQATLNGPYITYYGDHHRIYQFGWNGTGYQHLSVGGTSISDWAGNESQDYTDGNGVCAESTSRSAGQTSPVGSLPTVTARAAHRRRHPRCRQRPSRS
jgi:hypothetical protein